MARGWEWPVGTTMNPTARGAKRGKPGRDSMDARKGGVKRRVSTMSAADYWRKRAQLAETEYKLSLLGDIEALQRTSELIKRLWFRVWYWRSLFEQERKRADKLEKQLKALFPE